MNIDQRTSETFDKENPPHPLSSHKKNAPSIETTQKKAVLGENTQVIVPDPVEEECPSSPIGDRLMMRKRKNQAKRKTTDTFGFKLFQC